MAYKIQLSDEAKEPTHFTFATAEFDLSGKKTYETDDPNVVAEAENNALLTVTYPKVEIVEGAYHEQLAPEDDPFTFEGQKVNPNDPAAAQQAEADKYSDDAVVAPPAPVQDAPAVEVPTDVVTGDDKTSSTTKDKN